MGDRANCYVKDGKIGVFLYTHWDGYALAEEVQKALSSKEGRGRWNDNQYLARIIFDTMTGLQGGETGFGISARLCDNEHPILVVDTDTTSVYLTTEQLEEIPNTRIIFDKFTKLSKDKLQKWWDQKNW